MRLSAERCWTCCRGVRATPRAKAAALLDVLAPSRHSLPPARGVGFRDHALQRAVRNSSMTVGVHGTRCCLHPLRWRAGAAASRCRCARHHTHFITDVEGLVGQRNESKQRGILHFTHQRCCFSFAYCVRRRCDRCGYAVAYGALLPIFRSLSTLVLVLNSSSRDLRGHRHLRSNGGGSELMVQRLNGAVG